MSLMARVDQARGRLQASTEQLSGARGLLNSNLGGEIGEIGDGFSSFFKRLWEEASDTWDSITNPIETLKGAWAGLQEAVDDPGEALEEAWNGLKAPFEDIKEDWNEGREGEAIGQGLAEVVLLASPTKFFKGLKGLGALGGDGDDAPDSPDASTGSSGLPGGVPSDDEPPGGDPPSSDSDGPGDEPPGGDPPSGYSDEPDDENSDSDNDNGHRTTADDQLEEGRKVSGDFPKEAEPNEVLYREGSDGRVTHYQTYDEDGLPIKRVDLEGKAHGGVPTPHVQEYTRNTNPATGETYVNKSPRVRPATPDEIPNN